LRSLPAEALESPLVRDALGFATEAHADQLRKGDGLPYIDHPVEVAAMLHEAGLRDTVVAAGLLHDVIEDCGVPGAVLEERFGREVATLVETLTAEETDAPYEQRKQAHRVAVGWAGMPAAAIYAADKLSNLRALNAAYAEQGEALAERFNAPLDAKEDNARRDIEMLERVRPAPPFLGELRTELKRFRELRRSLD